VRAVPGLGLEYCLELRGDALRLTAEASEDVAAAQLPALARALEQEFTRLTTLRIPAEVVAPGSLARAEMKSRRLIRA
jgi:phenylacetate-coenzyme A ligase PaaK-like adenylate-forming protein